MSDEIPNNEINEAIILRRINNQIKLCEDNNYPHFAPKNGVCWSCRKNIFTKKTGTNHITACPHCYTTYCD